jgi:hypothetical protein
MRTIKLALVAALSIAAGAVAGVLTTPTAVEAKATACANTYCLPGQTTCFEYTGWECGLNQGCASNDRCPIVAGDN